MDVVVVADSSVRAGMNGFRALQRALVRIVGDFDIADLKVHMGLVTFSDHVDKVINLSDNANNLKSQISGLQASQGGTNIGPAIDRATQMLQTYGRQGVPHVRIVFFRTSVIYFLYTPNIKCAFYTLNTQEH